MTVNELYSTFIAELNAVYDIQEAAGITAIAFEYFAGITKADLIREGNNSLGEETIKRLNDCLFELKEHKPIQYITGEAWFYKMKLKVSKAVLIPRPETEELAELVIIYLKAAVTATILDVGTGSGCIAIAIKKNIPAAHVTAIDISNDGLLIAKENAGQQQVDIDFVQSDFLAENNWQAFQSFDVIVSNPPYIPEKEKEILDKNVTAFEPALALFVANENPLIFYEKLAAFGKKHLNVRGKIMMEVHEDLAAETALLFNNEYYSAIIKKDMSGKQRMLIATRHYP